MTEGGPSEYYSQSAGPSNQASWGNTQMGSGRGGYSYSTSWSNNSENSEGGGNNYRGNRWRGRPSRGYYQQGRPAPSHHYNYNQSNQFHPNPNGMNNMWNISNITSIPPPPLPGSMPGTMSGTHSSYHHHQPYQRNQQKGDYYKHRSRQQNGNNNKNRSANPDSKDNEGFSEGTSKGEKRKSMSQNFPPKHWNKEDAEMALKVEQEISHHLRRQSLVVRFPDQELSRDIVQKYHPGIAAVHFQVPSGPRYCFVHLDPEANSDKTMEFLESISFGTGKLTVEKKVNKEQENLTPDSIDPYSLYIGSLPANVSVATLKEKFPSAVQIDFGSKTNIPRCAYIRFDSVEKAIKAYRENNYIVVDSRRMIVRFRRLKRPNSVPVPGPSSDPKKSTALKSDQPPPKKTKNAEDEAKPLPETERVEVKQEDDDDEEDDDDDEDDDDEGTGNNGEDRLPTQNVDDDDDDDDDDDFQRVERPADDDDDENGVMEGDDEWDADPQSHIDSKEQNSDNLFRDLDARLGGLGDIGEPPFVFK